MEQAQRRIEQINQVCASCLSCAFGSVLFEIQTRLNQFQIPVAELSPEEIVDAIGGLVKAICRERIVHVGDGPIKT